MDDLVSYYTTQKEKLTIAIQKDDLVTQKATINTQSNIQQQQTSNITYKNISTTEEEAKSRLLSSLIKDIDKKCDEYLQLTHNSIRDDITMIFGSDGKKDSVLHELYQKLCYYQEKVTSNQNDCTKRSEHVVNLDFHECCVRCSTLSTRHKSRIMKKLMDYERSKYSKKSYLCFTTRYRGRCIQVVVTLPCPVCPAFDEKTAEPLQPDIKTIPYIEDEYTQKNGGLLLLQDPIAFIENSLWRWVDDHSG